MTVSKINKKRSKWLIPLAVIAVVVFAAWGLFALYEGYRLSQTPENVKKTREIFLSKCASMPFGYDKDKCFINLAEYYKDSGICLYINDSHSRNKCYYNLAEVMKNISLCDPIVEDYYRDSCYKTLSIAISDPVLCEKIKNVRGFREDCYAAMAPGRGDPELCEKVVDSVSLRSNCFEDVATHNLDPAICDRMELPAYCIMNLAKKMRNSSVCERMKDEGYRDDCYKEMLRLTKDKSLCGKIVRWFEWEHEQQDLCKDSG